MTDETKGMFLGLRIRVRNTFIDGEDEQTESIRSSLRSRPRTCPAALRRARNEEDDEFIYSPQEHNIELAPLLRPLSDGTSSSWLSTDDSFESPDRYLFYRAFQADGHVRHEAFSDSRRSHCVHQHTIGKGSPVSGYFKSNSSCCNSSSKFHEDSAVASTDAASDIGGASSVCWSSYCATQASDQLTSSNSDAFVSRGSALHDQGLCKPCAWFWKPSGCCRGEDCDYCHICTEADAEKHARTRKLERRVLARKGPKSGRILRKREQQAAEVEAALQAAEWQHDLPSTPGSSWSHLSAGRLI